MYYSRFQPATYGRRCGPHLYGYYCYIVTYFSEPHMDVYAISHIYDYHCYIIADFCQLLYTYKSPYQ